MPIGRRLTTLLLALALIASPAVALRASCVGESCTEGETTSSTAVPFCPLPAPARELIANGFRQGRSPDVMATTAVSAGVRSAAAPGVPWPTAADVDIRVPIAFLGTGFTGDDPPDGTRLDQIAATLAEAMGYQRAHPQVRSGVPAPGVAVPGGSTPSLVVQIVWKGVGTPDLEARTGAWPFLASLLRRGSGTLEGTTGSLPLDPAATLTTIGTGGLPSQHGITGELLRAVDGQVAEAWHASAPGSVISTLADDLDRDAGQGALVVGVLDERSDRGLIGDGWYVDRSDRDVVSATPKPVPAIERILDEVSPAGGIIGVVVRGLVADVDRTTERIVHAVRAQVPTAAFVVTATGSLRGAPGTDAATIAGRIEASVGSPVIEAVAADGFFMDREVATRAGITADDLSKEMSTIRTPAGKPLFAGAYPSFAVAFSRYC